MLQMTQCSLRTGKLYQASFLGNRVVTRRSLNTLEMATIFRNNVEQPLSP